MEKRHTVRPRSSRLRAPPWNGFFTTGAFVQRRPITTDIDSD
jgi:hypothetical protein